MRDQILATPRWWRFLRFPLERGGGPVHYIGFQAAERTFGVSKYDFKRLIGFAIEGFVSLMSPGRLSILLAAVGIAAYASASGGAPVFAGILAILAVLTTVESYRLSRRRLLSRMRVCEQSCE